MAKEKGQSLVIGKKRSAKEPKTDAVPTETEAEIASAPQEEESAPTERLVAEQHEEKITKPKITKPKVIKETLPPKRDNPSPHEHLATDHEVPKKSQRHFNQLSSKAELEDRELLEAYEVMLRARLVDQKTIILYKQNKCHFQIGCAGHEAVQVAAGRIFRPGKDWFYPYYRGMAICAALGMTNRDFMLNAMNKRDDPNSHGWQMPMHFGHIDFNIVNQSSPTGTQFLQAVGIAIAASKNNSEEVVFVSSGEGTCAQGDFHESINWAARDKLPVVFLIQNNAFAISVPVSEQLAGESVAKIASGYEGLGIYEVDGTDYSASHEALSLAHKRALNGEGPSLIEAHVPRLQSHSISDNHLKYRSLEEIEKDQERDPIALMASLLIDRNIATESELSALREELQSEIDQAALWAEEQPDNDPAEIYDHVYVDPEPWDSVEEGVATGEDVFMVDALNHGLREELEVNSDVYVFGEDVAHGKGGVFTVTQGLTEEFGVERVFNTQLAESSIVGTAIGMATRGLKPVVEIQFGDYVWTAMMQIRNELAMLNYRSAGDFSCPVVVRIAVGGYIRGGCYHSQNIEATFAHFPGLFIVYPSNATDAKGLLKAAIRSDDPVLFLEHKGLYRQPSAKGPEGDEDFLVPIGRANIVRAGSDATIITWGALVHKSLVAAETLSKEGYSVEVIDLRTIVPLDLETIAESVANTSRALIAHEDVEFMGFGAEVAAQIADVCFDYLDAPIKRVAMKNVAAVPHPPILEQAVLPQEEDVTRELRKLLEY